MLIIKLKPTVALFLLSFAFAGVFAQVSNVDDHEARAMAKPQYKR